MELDPNLVSNDVFLRGDSRLTQFVSLLDQVGISANLGETILAPTTDAFLAFENEDGDVYLNYTENPKFVVHLQDLLSWHIVTEGTFALGEIFDDQRTRLENLIGNITVNQEFQEMDTVPATAIIESDIETLEGIVHVTDSLIIPPYLKLNMIPQLLDPRSTDIYDYSFMANLALHVFLDEELNTLYENGLTFLVAPNDRWLSAGLSEEQLMDPAVVEFTRSFLRCHMILDIYHETEIFARNNNATNNEFLVTTFLGTSLWVTTTEGKLRFQATDVLVVDQATRNGIFHAIDSPLLPPVASDFISIMNLATSWNLGTWQFLLIQVLQITSQDISDMVGSSISLWLPIDEAFGAFNIEVVDRFQSPVFHRHAMEFVLAHVSTPAMTRQSVIDMAPLSITMLNGESYQVQANETDPYFLHPFSPARSKFGDVIGLDGYLHLLDNVLLPTAVSKSIYDRLVDDGLLFTDLLDAADLVDLVDRDLPITVLAPYNIALENVDYENLDVQQIVQDHIFSGNLFLDDLANMTEITSIGGTTYAVETIGEDVFVNDAFLYEGDIFANNGVLHYIDRVLGVSFNASAIDGNQTNSSSTSAPTFLDLNNTFAPSISPAPTISAAPSMLDSVLFGNETNSSATSEPTFTVDLNNTFAPSISPAPTLSAAPSMLDSLLSGNETSAPTFMDLNNTSSPSLSPAPTMTAAPTINATSTGEPDQNQTSLPTTQQPSSMPSKPPTDDETDTDVPSQFPTIMPQQVESTEAPSENPTSSFSTSVPSLAPIATSTSAPNSQEPTETPDTESPMPTPSDDSSGWILQHPFAEGFVMTSVSMAALLLLC